MCIGEASLQCAQTAVLLYIFQDGEVNVMNSFPRLRGQKTLLNKESDLVFHLHEFAEILLVVKGVSFA